MASLCGVNHRTAATANACPRCRAERARRAAVADGPPRFRRDRQIAVPDSSGRTIVLDPDNPVISRKRLTAAAVACLPPGVRFRGCMFAPGVYALDSAVLEDCRGEAGSRIALSGQAVARRCTFDGDAAFSDEAHSETNSFRGLAVFANAASSRGDYFAAGYSVVDGTEPTIDSPRVVPAQAASDDGQRGRAARELFERAAKDAGRSVLMRAVDQLLAGGRRRR